MYPLCRHTLGSAFFSFIYTYLRKTVYFESRLVLREQKAGTYCISFFCFLDYVFLLAFPVDSVYNFIELKYSLITGKGERKDIFLFRKYQYKKQKTYVNKRCRMCLGTVLTVICLCGCADKISDDELPQPTRITEEITKEAIQEEVLTSTITQMSTYEITPTQEVPLPTLVPTEVNTPTPTLIPVPTKANTLTPTVITVPTEQPIISERKIIAIDAGHQGKGNYEKEPLGPGATELKAKVSSGTEGISTGVPEYELTLAVSLQLKEELTKRGYDVVMIRETNDVNISNAERAAIANASADIFLRIHADGSTNTEAHGISILYPSAGNPFVAYLHEESKALSAAVLEEMCESTGARNRGMIERDDLSGINWCEIPVALIEMGFMTNQVEDEKMQTAEYQALLVEGICDGVDAYFEQEE